MRIIQKDNVLIAPNPAAQTLSVKFSTPNALWWQVLSTSGQLLLEGKIAEEQDVLSLPVGHLSSGAYLLRIEYRGGTHSSHRFAIVK